MTHAIPRRPVESNDARVPTDDGPTIGEVLDVLKNDYCRTILTTIDEPMSAKEIAEATDIPLSTVYRELERLTEAGLVEDGVRIQADGTHPRTFVTTFQRLTIRVTGSRGFELGITGRDGATPGHP